MPCWQKGWIELLDNMSQREKLLLVLAILLVIIAVYYFYIYKPLSAEINSLKADKELKEKRIAADKKLIEKLPALREEFKKLLAEHLKRESFYQEKTIIDLLIDMREVTKKNDVELVRYQPVENKEQIKMNVQLKGDYFQLCDLFRDFESWNDWFEFANLRLKGQGEMINVSMSIIYHKKPDEGDKE